MNSHQRLVAFLYVLMRDYTTPGNVELIIRDHVQKANDLADEEKDIAYSNKYLQAYAEDVLNRIIGASD